MYDLAITVTKVMGACPAEPPMKKGDCFFVSDGSVRIPEGESVCIWALHNLVPLLPAKERNVAEAKDEDWLWRVNHMQCPDPDGRVIFKIEQQATTPAPVEVSEPAPLPDLTVKSPEAAGRSDLRVVVDEVRGKCTSPLRPGDYFSLRGGQLSLPAGRHFCLYALQAVLPFLAARQRQLQDGDWLKDAQFICHDPAGNVVMRIERI